MVKKKIIFGKELHQAKKLYYNRAIDSSEHLLMDQIKEAGDFVVELDQFKATLNTFKDPLQEVRDSL